MEQKIIEILKSNFKEQDVDKARKELCFLFGVKRVDEPVCPDCVSDDLTCLGNYTDTQGLTGTEYICDNCKKEFDFDDYA